MRFAPSRLWVSVVACLGITLSACQTSRQENGPPAPPPGGSLGASDDPKDPRLVDWEEAVDAYEQDPTEDRAIWVGRRLGYLGRYAQAIEWYSSRLDDFPQSYRLLRHRGHRYITERQFGAAISDLERAWSLARHLPNRVEPDGAPGPTGIPRSTDHGNILYHLGLAHYLEGRFDKGAEWFARAVETATNHDSDVAARAWLVSCLQRAGRSEEAQALLEADFASMDVIENFQYRDLLLHFAGQLTAEEARAAAGNGIAGATLLYGLANRLGWDGGDNRADLEHIRSTCPSAAFGTIAAEADLAR